MSVPLERWYVALARRPVWSGLLVALAAIAFAVAGTAAAGFPPPLVHDEWSYLLGAETFASGRLTNPAHPMWRFFETFHVLQQPTYMSKYPPANALFLAAGWAVTGHPIVGVWLSVVFMCVCVHWMLRKWVSDNVALGVSLAFAATMGGDPWSSSFWGGAVAAGAGALTLGAVHRILEGESRPVDACLLGLGLLLLANSRPYEGALLALPAAVLLLRWLVRDSRSERRRRVTQVLLPLSLIGAIGLAAMMVYNRRVVGHWMEMPYTAYQKARDPTPIFLWQTPYNVPAPTEPVFRQFAAEQDSVYRARRTVVGRVKWAQRFVRDHSVRIIPAALLAPLILLPLARRNRWTRFGLVTLAWVAFGMSLTTFYLRHYGAPLVCVVLALYGTCLRWLSRMRIGRLRPGPWLASAVIVAWMGFGAGRILSVARNRPSVREEGWVWRRQEIARELTRRGRRDLVVVRYGPKHVAGREWVYNSADIDGAPVIWARDRGMLENERLLRYFADRDAWLLDIDEDRPPFVLLPYPRAASDSSGAQSTPARPGGT